MYTTCVLVWKGSAFRCTIWNKQTHQIAAKRFVSTCCPCKLLLEKENGKKPRRSIWPSFAEKKKWHHPPTGILTSRSQLKFTHSSGDLELWLLCNGFLSVCLKIPQKRRCCGVVFNCILYINTISGLSRLGVSIHETWVTWQSCEI